MHRPWQILPSTFFSQRPKRLALMMPFVFASCATASRAVRRSWLRSGALDELLRVEFGADTQLIPPGDDHGLMRFSRRIAFVEPLH